MRVLAVGLVGVLVLAACAAETAPTSSIVTTSSTTPQDAATPTTFPEGSVPAVLAADGRFAVLVELLRVDAASLLAFMSTEAFNGTLFAPLDQAFDSLPPDRLTALRGQQVGAGRSALVVLLQHHLVSGRWSADQLRAMEAAGPGVTEPAGGHGGPITIEVDGGTIRVDGAAVVEEDIEAANGIIHVIDAVMSYEP